LPAQTKKGFSLFSTPNLKVLHIHKMHAYQNELESFLMKNPQIEVFFCQEVQTQNITKILPKLKTLGIFHDFNLFDMSESLVLEKAYLPTVPSKCIFPNLKCLHLNLNLCSKREYHQASMFTQIEELGFWFHRIPQFSFDARLINRMKNIKCLRIDQSVWPKERKNYSKQWKPNKHEYLGTSLKLIQWSGPGSFHISPILEFFKKLGIKIENSLPTEEFLLFGLGYN
jgi:hypothetical protein